MAKCPICNETKGKRPCRRFGNSDVCSLCCGQTRNARECVGCEFYSGEARPRQFTTVPLPQTQRKDSENATVVMTLTNELYLPGRLIYEVYDAKSLRAWLKNDPGMEWDPGKKRWTWNYQAGARKLKFPPSYHQIPATQEPMVLASCYLVNNRTFHVYTRCAVRATLFLVFFDKQVSRSIALGKFTDEYNFLTTKAPGASVPFPEEYFKDESQIEFLDLEGLMDAPKSPERKAALVAFCAAAEERTLAPLERKRLDLFYQGGQKAMEQAMFFRETLAMLQMKSDTPICPMKEIMRMIKEKE